MFENAVMLAGVGGAAVPLIVHLLTRARYREVKWGAMMFLETSRRGYVDASRLKQWMLLGLRMMAVALLAMALARPVIGDPTPEIATPQTSITAAIVVDCSVSMGVDEGGITRMDLARGAVLRILSNMKRGDQVALVLAGAPARRGGVMRPNADLQMVATRVAELSPTGASANLADAITTAVNLLDESGRSNRHLYVVCDRQASSWNQVTEHFVAAWRDRVEQSLARFVVVPVGGEESANVAITSMGLRSPPAVRDTTGEIEVQVRNYGRLPRVGLPLTVTSEGRELYSTTLNLMPDSGTTVRFPMSFAFTGSQILTAEVRSRGLTFDDRLSCVVNVVDPIRTLIVEDATTTGTITSGSQYLQAALAPYRTARRLGPDLAAVSVITPEHLADVDPAHYQVIILSNVSELAPQQVRVLERQVYRGGGLLIAPSAGVSVDAYNQALHRGGTGLSPAILGAPLDHRAAAPVRVREMSHPVFRFLNGNVEHVPASAIERYFSARPSPGAMTLAWLGTGDPLVIEKTYGRGRALLITAPLAYGEWGELPLSGFYLPFVQSMVRYLASGALGEQNLLTGGEIVARFDEALEGSAIVQLPGGETETVEVAAAQEPAEVRFASTHQPGIYIVRVKLESGERAVPFVVRTPAHESDLTPLSAERWTWLEQSLGFTRADREEEPALASVSSDGPRELWLEMLGVVMLLLVMELGLARWWSRGAGA